MPIRHIAIHCGRPGSPHPCASQVLAAFLANEKDSLRWAAAFVAMGDLEAAQKLTADAAVNREMATKWAEAV